MSRLLNISIIITVIALLFSCEPVPPVNVVTPGGTVPSGGNGSSGDNTEVPGDNGGNSDKPIVEATVPESDKDAVKYADLHDELHDAGQFFIPESKLNPKACWTMVYSGAGYGVRNETDQTDVNSGLQNFLLMQSIVGLVNRACEQGLTDVAIWVEQGGRGYKDERSTLGPEIGRQTAFELATKTYGPWEGIDVNVKQLFDGYVLTDVVGNPESANVAAVASHVYNSIIVDVRDRSIFDEAGYKMTYDASRKSLKDAFAEFKDRCSNDCLVLMPVKCGEHRDYVIKNNLFVVNLNRSWAGGDCTNMALYKEVLSWLKPGSQIIGWEQGVGEDSFVGPASEYGHQMLAADWSYNLTMTSHNYRERQPSTLAKVINPRDIDYDAKAHYYSTFLTDGDNYQFIITDNFVDNYYDLGSARSAKTAFEIGTQSLIQLAPTRFDYLMRIQPSAENTVMETFGGGYYYIDTYSKARPAQRAANLKRLAERTAAHMRQHGIKVLHVMAKDIRSEAAKEALQAFVDANDQLEGITAVQYNPYIGGDGDIIWLTNKAGYDIPCITTRYMAWSGLYSPEDVTSRMQSREEAMPSFCTVCLHCWSVFDGRKSTDIARLLAHGLPDTFKAVSMQELIWRVRMAQRREQTRKYLSTIK